MALVQKIRLGLEPDNPGLIVNWLSDGSPNLSCVTGSERRLELRRAHHRQQFYLLLETVTDQQVPRQWRCICLDYIHKPIFALKRISTTQESDEQLRQMLRELAVQTRYLQGGPIN